MRIALGQLESGADVRANLAAIDRFTAEAARDGAGLVAFPEYATYEKKKVDATFPRWPSRWTGLSAWSLRPSPAATVSRWWRAWSNPRRIPAGRITLWWLSGPTAADWLSTGRSTFSTPRALGSRSSSSPDRPLTRWCSSTGGMRFGLMTCYDLRFPELARSLADAGAQVLLVCSSWVPGEHKTEQWLALNAARAIENSVYVAGVCQAPPVSVGRSVLVDPMGVVEADLGLEAGVRTVGVSVETADRVRESFPMFQQRRL